MASRAAASRLLLLLRRRSTPSVTASSLSLSSVICHDLTFFPGRKRFRICLIFGSLGISLIWVRGETIVVASGKGCARAMGEPCSGEYVGRILLPRGRLGFRFLLLLFYFAPHISVSVWNGEPREREPWIIGTLGLLRSYTHFRNYSSQLSAFIPAGPQSSKMTRRHYYVPNTSPYQLWSRSFASDNGDKIEAVVPYMGESVTDGTLANFLKKPGERVEADEPIAQIETDKVTIDVASPEAGVIEKLIASEGDTVTPGTIIAIVSKSSSPAETHVAPSEEATQKESPPANVEEKPPKVEPPKMQAPKPTTPPKTSPTEPQLPPKERERRVPMPRLRKRIANRLKDSQNTFAMLTTFNEVDMTNMMKLRSDYKDEFVKKHGVKLGLMSCFVKAAVSGLQNQPIVNAVIDGDDIIYRDYIDVSVAVGTSKGLVVPVIRDADTMNFAGIEKGINNLAKKATEGALSIDEMAGGTFTISNGGVYGSLISTPIINPPQSAILGMHSIVQRPVVVDGNILTRPMMYLALTYDHRLIDGREAVFFLRRIKDVVEDPRRLLLDI